MKNLNNILWTYDFGWDDATRQSFFEDYKDCYDEEPTDEELDRYIDTINSIDLEFLLDAIKSHEKAYGLKTYVVVAKIGRWNGTFDGGKVITGMYDTIMKCCQDCDYITILYENNQFKIVGHHHDGTNRFVIRELTSAGEDYIERHEGEQTDQELHQHLFNSHRWSKRVSIFPEIYGWES